MAIRILPKSKARKKYLTFENCGTMSIPGLRILYAFDPRRKAILLIGGDKRGDKNWYDRIIPIAEDIYLNHLEEIRREPEGGECDG